MAERIRRERTTHAVEQLETTELTTPRAAAIDYDALLDEIDEVLQGNAEDYVRSFVQKGGQ